ncbi:Recombination endonuclease VII [Thermomonospora echinospora]|uniref:Recombination endonuclease VII n=1 Tax=Thermomonospora echinospora TaxID=1992 RepID=A0A1H6A9H4_9ACTN|nr:endonuclease domain-containing protein [Thermomonospora echinospora]SEG44707.1 Recombination endonuclease VII [Thermomonospora echinospora]
MPSEGSTTARGYGYNHQQLRKALLAKLKARPGQPCPHCGHPMHPDQALDLDHTDDRTAYRGLAHRSCNTAAGARKLARRRRKAKAAKLTGRW